MARKYTRQQIVEAINYWQSLLEDENNTSNDHSVPTKHKRTTTPSDEQSQVSNQTDPNQQSVEEAEAIQWVKPDRSITGLAKQAKDHVMQGINTFNAGLDAADQRLIAGFKQQGEILNKAATDAAYAGIDAYHNITDKADSALRTLATKTTIDSPGTAAHTIAHSMPLGKVGNIPPIPTGKFEIPADDIANAASSASDIASASSTVGDAISNAVSDGYKLGAFNEDDIDEDDPMLDESVRMTRRMARW